MSGDIASGQNRRNRRSRPAAKPAKPKDGREKITLLISKETNVKLSTLAALKSVDRSTLADSILTEALRGVVISLRGGWRAGKGRGASHWRKATRTQCRLDERKAARRAGSAGLKGGKMRPCD